VVFQAVVENSPFEPLHHVHKANPAQNKHKRDFFKNLKHISDGNAASSSKSRRTDPKGGTTLLQSISNLAT
jgi:hypothetical protein